MCAYDLVLQSVLPLFGTAYGRKALTLIARPAAYGQFLFVAFAFICLTASFIGNDFSVLYVARHSNSALPLVYRIGAVWGGHEGSILLWLLILSGWTMAVSRSEEHTSELQSLMRISYAVFCLKKKKHRSHSH